MIVKGMTPELPTNEGEVIPTIGSFSDVANASW